MAHCADISRAERLSTEEAALRVRKQRNVISTIRVGDPTLPYAKALLRQLEQSSVMAKINSELGHYAHSLQS